MRCDLASRCRSGSLCLGAVTWPVAAAPVRCLCCALLGAGRCRSGSLCCIMHYLLTFRTYGTWLHGDERGSVDRHHNQVGAPLIGPNGALRSYRRDLMKAPTVIFDDAQRQCVRETLQEAASYRGWTIHALNVLSNHVHLVIETNEHPDKANPDKVVATLKARATRALREAELFDVEQEIWAVKASTRYLKTPESIERASHYTLNMQHLPGDT